MSDLLLDDQPIQMRSHFTSGLGVVETIFRSRSLFFQEIRDEIDLTGKIRAMLLSSTVFLALYGGVMGAAHSLPQMLSSAVKLPALFLITLFICAPSLYFFNILFGSRQTILQNIALILTAMTTTSVLLLSLAPVTLFFLTTTSDYTFFKLLNVGIFAVAGVIGLGFLRQGFAHSVDADNAEGHGARQRLFSLWMILYAFVGTQMAWTLSPFMGEPGMPFMLVRRASGNFYVDVLGSLFTLVAGF